MMQNNRRLFGHELTNVEQRRASISRQPFGLNKRPSLKCQSKNSSIVMNSKPSLPPMVNGKDEQNVLEYLEDNVKHMLEVEKTQKNVDYMLDQSELTMSIREVLLDWIVELNYKMRMFPNTLFLTVNIIDRYLQMVEIQRNKLQLLAIAAFFIASKYEETYNIPELSDLMKISSGLFTQDQILQMQGNIIKILDFNILQQTSFRFLQPLASIIDLMDAKNFYLCRYVLQLSLYDSITFKYSPSLIACSTIYLINKIRKRQIPWRTQLQKLTSYKQSDLKSPARQLCYILQNARNFQNAQNLRKKFSRQQYYQVTRIKIQRKTK